MERKSLLYQPSGQAASTAPSQIRAPLGAFGGGQGMSDLGQGIANAGSHVARIQEEQALRKQQDSRLSAGAATFFASKAATAKVDDLSAQIDAGTANIDEIDEDQFVKDVDKTYKDTLNQELTKRKVPTAYAASDEYIVSHGGKHEQVQAEALRFAAGIKETKRTTGQTLENQGSIDDYDRTGDMSPAFRALSATNSLRGVKSSTREALASSQREAIELRLPDTLDKQGYTDEQRDTLQKEMVSLGWSSEKAALLTKREGLSDTTKSELKKTIEIAARNGDTAAAAAAAAKLASHVTKDELTTIQMSAASHLRTSQLVSSVAAPALDSPLRTHSALVAMQDRLEKDSSGYKLLQADLASSGITGVDQDVLRQQQSSLLSAVKAQRNLIETSPMEAIMKDSAVSRSAGELSVVLDAVITGKTAVDNKKVLDTLSIFRSTCERAAQSMGIEASRVTPIPTSITDPILARMADRTTSEGAVKLFVGFANLGNATGIGSDVGRALALGIVERASKHDNEAVRKMTPALFVTQQLSLSGGANTAEAVNRILQSSFDPQRLDSAEKSLVEMKLSDAFAKTKRPVSPANIVEGALFSMSPGTTIDTGIASTISGVFSSHAADQTLVRHAAAMSNMATEAGIKLDNAQMMEYFGNWVTVDAASSGGALTERGLMGSAGSLASLINSAGLVVAEMEGQDYLVQHNITDTAIYSQFGVTKEASTTSLAQMPAAAKALLGINEVIRDRASIDFRINSNSKEGDSAWTTKAMTAVTGALSMGLGGLVSDAVTSSPQGTPADKLQAHAARAWAHFSDTNYTFLFTGNHIVGDLDIEAHFYPQEVLKEYGFVMDSSDPKMSKARFEANTRWFPNLDGSMSKHYVTGDVRTIGGKVDASVIKKGAIVAPDATNPRANVDAALLYITLQGTRAQESFNNQYERDAYESYAGETNYAGEPTTYPNLRLKAGRTAPTSEELNVAFARHIRNLVANRSAQNGTNHTRKPPAKPTVRSTPAPVFYNGGSVPIGAPPSSTSVQFDSEQDR